MGHKANYIASKGLGGGMFWELSGDTSDYALLDSLNANMQ
jgi:GH18 family chitinase